MLFFCRNLFEEMFCDVDAPEGTQLDTRVHGNPVEEIFLEPQQFRQSVKRVKYEMLEIRTSTFHRSAPSASKCAMRVIKLELNGLSSAYVRRRDNMINEYGRFYGPQWNVQIVLKTSFCLRFAGISSSSSSLTLGRARNQKHIRYEFSPFVAIALLHHCERKWLKIN